MKKALRAISFCLCLCVFVLVCGVSVAEGPDDVNKIIETLKTKPVGSLEHSSALSDLEGLLNQDKPDIETIKNAIPYVVQSLFVATSNNKTLTLMTVKAVMVKFINQVTDPAKKQGTYAFIQKTYEAWKANPQGTVDEKGMENLKQALSFIYSQTSEPVPPWVSGLK